MLLGARDAARGQQAERALHEAGAATARYLPLDVTDEKSAAQAAAWIDAEYGQLGILVNNAGITRRAAARQARPRWPRCARCSRPTCLAWSP